MKQTGETIVQTKFGKIEGLYRDNLYIFKGIPYAAPPIERRRWLPPEPVKPWTGIRPARTFGNAAPQNVGAPAPFQEFNMENPQSEDCLYLNVWTPGLDDHRRPVLVWIHGGGFNLGSGSQPLSSGEMLAQRGDSVIVSLNYRLGALGFLNLNDITGGKIPATGNEGLLDQVAALEWVRDNIAKFGGNPENVTVFGESSGAMSIGCLMAMPLARGLFHKAILQSGAASTAVSLEAGVRASRQFSEALGLGANDYGAWMKLPPGKLVSAHQQIKSKLARPWENERISLTTPVIDGNILPARPLDSINKGSASKVSLLIGTNQEECKLFNMLDPGASKLDEAGLFERCKYLVPAEIVPALLTTYRNIYSKLGITSNIELFSAIQTDLMFRIPAIRLGNVQSSLQPVYQYLFDWNSPVFGGVLGSCHALEVSFVFGTNDDSFSGTGPAVEKLSRSIQDGWLAFARTGNPSCRSLGNWPAFADRGLTMVLGPTCRIEEKLYRDESGVWGSIRDEFTGQI